MFSKKKFRDKIGQLTSGYVLRHGSFNQTSEETDELFDRVEYDDYIIDYDFSDCNNPKVTIRNKNNDIILDDLLSHINPDSVQVNSGNDKFIKDISRFIKEAYDYAK